ncbi:hypothetical protein ACF1B0_20955 [Streptomyces anandii]|uniref:hypothetical protein n=1 Tax=Streptomyces anandii TaxID=285454 RepID=UPI0037033A39
MSRPQRGPALADTSRTGAGIGLLAALLFLVAFLFFLTTSPTGSPGLPDVGDARFAPAYFAENLDAVRISTLLTAVGVTLFLWFLAHLWARLRPAEPAPGQDSMVVLIGGVAGSVLVLAGLALTATSGLSTTTDQAVNVSTLYVASALLTALGGAVFSIFFFGVAKVILRTGAMARWLGWLAVLAALLCACAVMTPFFTANILNAATGALGRWCWTAALFVWLLLASGAMALGERRRAQASSAAAGTPEVA